MPICIALDSADAWAHPEILRIDRDGRPDAVAGVPPDYFSEDGQLWGNPLYDWDAHERSHYRWWVERLAASAELADMVRIDHFRGFEAYWKVPAGDDTALPGSDDTVTGGPGIDRFALGDWIEDGRPVEITDIDTDYHVFIVRYSGDYIVHSHEKDEFVYILEGALNIEIDGREVEVRQGEAMLIPAGANHRTDEALSLKPYL